MKNFDGKLCARCRGINTETYDRSGILRLMSRVHNGVHSTIEGQQESYEDMKRDSDHMHDYMMRQIYCICKLDPNLPEAVRVAKVKKDWAQHLKMRAYREREKRRYYAYRYKWWQRPLVIWFDMKFKWSRV